MAHVESGDRKDAAGDAELQARFRVGDVFQINHRHGRSGWVGAFLLATEIKSWGVMGFVHHVESHATYGRAYIRLPWDQLDYVGHAALMPADDVEKTP